MFLHICSEAVMVTSNAAGLVNLYMYGLPARAAAYFSGKVHIHCGNDARIDQTVDGAFADHDGIPVCHTDMMWRLFLPDERRDYLIKMPDLIFRQGNTGA